MPGLWWDELYGPSTTTSNYLNLYASTTGATTLANSYYSNRVWTQWTDVSTSTTTGTDMYWSQWIQDRQLRGYQPAQPAPAPRVRTAEEIAAEDARVRAYQQEAARQRALREKAEAIAEALLLHHLTPEQVDDYKRHKHFVVCGRSGSRYRVRCGMGISGNIDLLNERGVKVAQFCAHAPGDSMVGADHYLTQALNLRHNEEEFLRVANRSNVAH